MREMAEKCGVFAMKGRDLSLDDFRNGFNTLQRRGQHAAGAYLVSEEQSVLLAAPGPIAALFDNLPAQESPHQLFLGHNRYCTSAGTADYNTQPFVFADGDNLIALAVNGNIPKEGIEQLNRPDSRLSPMFSDSAIMADQLLVERKKYKSWQDTFVNVLSQFQGAFSLACTTDDRDLFLARDPWGIRPLCLGKKGEAWVCASESSALKAMGAEYLREILPGELIHIDRENNFHSVIYAVTTAETRCLLESHYFSRPDSYDGQDVMRTRRQKLGRLAARRFKGKGIEVDLLIPILNSGREMAKGAASELGMSLFEAIHVNGEQRSFIENSPEERERVVHGKHVIDSNKIADERILICDDSAVRGLSLGILVRKIKANQFPPSEIHVLLSSEPVVDICDLGVDLATQEELIAGGLNGDLETIEKVVAQALGVDSVTYLDPKSIALALETPLDQMCRHCFGGPHPIRDHREPQYRNDGRLREQQVLFLASGSGSNVEKLLQEMKVGTILARPTGVITNNPTAGVIQKAAQFGVASLVMPSKGKLKNQQARLEYEKELLEVILTQPQGLPQVIVLAGWMLVLSDDFLTPLWERGIKVINIHPALLSGKGADCVTSSMGEIPELRGAHAINDASALSLEVMPVTGVTVHEVVPNSQVDTGNVIIKEEVRRHPDQSLADLETSIHESEHRIFAIALQRILLLQAQERIYEP